MTTVTPDEEEVKVKSKPIFRPKPSAFKTVTNNVTLNYLKMVNLSMTIKDINQTTMDVISLPQHLLDSRTSTQSDHSTKSHLVTEEATSKSLAKFLLLGKGIKTHPLNEPINRDTIYVPRFHNKKSNDIDEMDHKVQNRAYTVIRFKRDIKTLSVPQQYAPVNIALKPQHSHSAVVPPKPQLNRSYGPMATRTTSQQSQISNIDTKTKQKNALKLKWDNYNKKYKMPKKVNNITTIKKSQNFFKNIYLDVLGLSNSTEMTLTKSSQRDSEKQQLRVKRDLPESATQKTVTIEEPKKVTNLNVTLNSVSTDQTVSTVVLQKLNNIFTKNLSEAVHEVFHELKIIALTPSGNKFPGSDLLFKIPSK